MLLSLYLAAGERYSVHERLGDYPDLLSIPIVYLVGQPRAGRSTPKLPAHATIRKPVATSDLLPKVEAAMQRGGTEAGADDPSDGLSEAAA